MKESASEQSLGAGILSLKFILFVFSVIIGEILVMWFLANVNFVSEFQKAVLDGVFIGIWASVFCYFFYVSPLQKTLKSNSDLHSEMETLNSNLQFKVSEQHDSLQAQNNLLSRNFQIQEAQTNLLNLALEESPLMEFLSRALSQILSIPWLSLDGKGLIFLVDEDCKNLVMKAQQGMHPSLLEACKVVPFGKCLCGKVAATGQMIFCESLVPEHEIEYSGMRAHGHWCFPVIDREKNLGVLNVYVPPGRKPQKDEENFLKSAAATLALAIKRRLDGQKLHLMYQAVEQSPLMVTITDAAGNIEITNSGFKNVSGYEKNETTGHLFSFLSADDAKPYQEVFATIHRGEVWHGLLHDRRKDGSLFWSRTIVSPVKDSQDQVLNFLIFKEDITKEIEAAAKQKELEEHALKMQRFQIVGTLASSIAHDFNNILQAVAGFSELALAGTTLEDVHKDVNEILLATTRGMDLINRFRNIGKPGQETKSQFSLANQIREIGAMLEAIVPLGVKFSVACKSSTGTIFAEPSAIQRVVLNMCMNAIHAMRPKGGKLTLELENVEITQPVTDAILPCQPGRYVSLRISDTGTGIPPEIKARIFEPYFTTKPPDEGTGLGLSSVLDTLSACNGFLTLNSKVGEGTTFTLFLPLTD